MATTAINGQRQIQIATITDDRLVNPMLRLSGALPMQGTLLMGSASPSTATSGTNTNPISSVTDPVYNQDAATKAYVDQKSGSIATGSMEALCATTANITLSGTQTIDGVSVVAGNKVLVKNQTTQSANGVYDVQTGAWTRDPAFNNWTTIPGMIVTVQSGTTNADTIWLCTAPATGTIGTTNITFVQMQSTPIQAGGGLSLSGSALSVVAADNSIQVNGSAPTGGTINVKIDTLSTGPGAHGALTVTASGLGVNTDQTLKITGTQLGVNPAAAGTVNVGGLQVVAGGVSAYVDGTTITIPTGTGKLTLVPNLFLSAANVTIREVPSGTINGVNTSFTLAVAPNPAGTEQLFLNGILQNVGAGNDYTISGNTITFITAPPTGSTLLCTYFNRGVPYA